MISYTDCIHDEYEKIPKKKREKTVVAVQRIAPEKDGPEAVARSKGRAAPSRRRARKNNTPSYSKYARAFNREYSRHAMRKACTFTLGDVCVKD